MLRIKNKLAKRILAFVLSGAMIVSGMSTSGMTVFAEEASTEAPEDTSTYSGEEEAAEEQQGDGAQANVDDDDVTETDKEQTPDKEDTDNEPNQEVSDNEAASDKESLEEAPTEEDKKDSESTTGDAEDEMTASDDAEEEETQGTDVDNKDGVHTVWIVGDSTVCAYDPALTYYPKYGYGTQVQNYLDETYVVNNLALSGRSSKSFLSETNYTTLKNGIQPGDVLIIGWGHNDEKAEADRYTNPNGDYQTKGSFAESLYTNYVKMAQDKQAFPILCTPIVRRNGSSDTLTPSNCHNTEDQVADEVTYKGGDYAQAIRDLGTAVNVPVVDLTAKTKELYETLGKDETLFLHMWSSSKPTSVDNTHINIYGAKKIAYILVTEIRNLTDLEIAAHVKENITEPTKEDLVVNDKYVEKQYTAPKSTDKSANWENYGIFRGTIFGSAVNASNAKLEKDTNGDMHMQVTGDKGKIASDNDSISMYFYQIPADSKFTLSATAKVNSIDANGQVGFGLMARDDMYIDSTDAVNSDYVAAGTLGKNSPNCFKRQDVTQTKGKKLTTGDVKAGDTVNLKIRRTPDGDGYECTYGNESPQTGGFDFALNTVDSEYIYIGMFAARNIDVTFSNIELIIDGKRINIETGNPIEEGGETGGTDEGGETKPAPSDEGGETKPAPSDEGGETKPAQSDEGGETKPAPSDEGGETKPSQNTGNNDSTKIPADSKDTTISIDNKDKITIAAADVVYTKKQPYAITVTYTYTKDGKPYQQQQLTEGLHYTVDPGNVDLTSVGSKTVTLIGTGKKTDLGIFTGQTTATYEVLEKKTTDKNDISKEKISLDNIKNLSYTGNYIIPDVKVPDELDDANYKIVYKNNVNAGKASATFVGQGNYYGTKVLTYTIKPTDLSKPTEELKLSASNVVISGSGKTYEVAGKLAYEGSAVTLEKLTITYAGKNLRPQEDYTITYKVNLQKLAGTATIKGINNFKGTFKINYELAIDSDVITKLNGLTNVPAEYSSKGARLTKINLGNGTILKENVDYKVTYDKACKEAELDAPLTIKIKGIGAYKDVIEKDTEIAAKVVEGNYYIKDGTIVDMKKSTAVDKFINAAKITDASGAKVKPADITVKVLTDNNTEKNYVAGESFTKINVSPSEENTNAAKYKTTTLSCRVAEKLSGVKPIGNIENQPFDGVNSVTLTEQRIGKYTGLAASDIRIVSYKNNNKLGSATVTIEGTESGQYYGTRNLKFKILADIGSDRNPGDEEGESKPGESSSGDETNPSEPSTGDETNPSEPSTGDEGDESNPSESSSEESSGEEESSSTGTTDEEDPTPSGKRIDVWDFGVKTETDKLYKNNITSAELSGKLTVDSSDSNKIAFSLTTGGEHTFGDLVIKYGKGDRIYADPNEVKDVTASDGKTITFPTLNNTYKKAYDDYTAAGGWYSNGARSSSTGYAEINAEAGDKIIIYVGNHQQTKDEDVDKDGNPITNNDTENNYITFTFAGQGDASAQSDEEKTINGREFEKFEFVAKYTGTYKFYQNAGQGRPFYNRIVRIPTVTVSGTINTGDTGISGYGLTFINKTDSNLPNVVATVDADGKYTAQLSAGYQYKALLTGSGTSGYGIKFTENADKVTTEIGNIVSGITKNFEVVSQTTYIYSGTITGFAPDYSRVSDLKITMVPTSEFDVNEEELTINTSDLTFTVNLQPDAIYTFKMEGVNDYEVKGPSQICIDNNADLTGQTITVGLKPMYDVAGGFNGLGDGVTVESLTFTSVSASEKDSNYEYTAAVASGGYSIKLRDGEYLANATVSDTTYSTTTHVVVDGGMVSQDLLFVSSASKENIEYEADIYVGYPKQANNYATVNEAVEAASLMKKGGAERTKDERVTIHIAPGTYREQILVNTPYVSFVNDTSEEVLLTWYYGIGYVYYSAGSDGFYDAQKAYDKYTKHGVYRWGCAVRVTADYFRAENITFENSFNRYITDEEIADGAEPDASYGSGYYTDTGINVPRNYTTDVTSKAATERAAAIAILDANYAEFYQCSFLSSQDTVYTSATAYFKNCLLEGMTDYLFGDGDVVFDNCELSWKGYSDNTQGGYITAVQGNTTNGYLFRNCTVTANGNLKVGAGYFGRPWRQDAKVTFVNTKLQTAGMIHGAGWHDMSGATAANAKNFKEYNTTTLDGSETIYDLTKEEDVKYKNLRESKQVETNPVSDVTKYFGDDWTPTYYTEDGSGVVTFSADPSIKDNGDINVPNPGHTLTVNYALSGDDAKNDVSSIKWYIVDDAAESSPTLVKASTAAVDKTYKITTAASGKYIKVEVTPETVDGRTGEMKSAILSTAIGNNYVDPSTGSNITVGEGINIYLAGDSTVKDYSAKGMWNGGTQSEDLGSWGEYIQSFFNESEVTVQNFAQGGRSVRSFINDDKANDGKQAKYSVIEKSIHEGDYLFIQFGHNDSSTLENKKDVYTPIGKKGSDDRYPYTSGEKNDAGLYPDYYKYTNGSIEWIDDDTQGTATYCWFLQQYVDMALSKGAIPVIMTPVARMQYSADGNKEHHEDEGNKGSFYWEAAKQVYEDNKERGALFIDTYKLTTELFNGAYSDGGGQDCGKEIMSISDGTHNNKLGGMVEAMLVAEAIQELDTPLSYAVKTPSQVSGSTTTGKTVFSVDSSSNFTAYEQKFTGSGKTAVYMADTFTTKSTYWSNYGNTKLDIISKNAGTLADKNISDSVVAAPKATSEMSDTDGKTIVTVTLSSATSGAKIYYTDDGVTSPKTSDGKKEDAAKEYDSTNKIVLDKDTTIKAFAMADGKTASKVVTFTFSVKPDVQPPIADKTSGSAIASGTVIHLEAMDGAEIRYTMGSGLKVSDPTVNSSLYDSEKGLTITSSTTIKAIAIKNGVKSDVATFEYVVNKMQTALSNLSPMMIDASQAIQAA